MRGTCRWRIHGPCRSPGHDPGSTLVRNPPAAPCPAWLSHGGQRLACPGCGALSTDRCAHSCGHTGGSGLRTRRRAMCSSGNSVRLADQTIGGVDAGTCDKVSSGEPECVLYHQAAQPSQCPRHGLIAAELSHVPSAKHFNKFISVTPGI